MVDANAAGIPRIGAVVRFRREWSRGLPGLWSVLGVATQAGLDADGEGAWPLVAGDPHEPLLILGDGHMVVPVRAVDVAVTP